MFPAYVIHSPSLPQRKAHIQKEMDRAGISFEWITGYEPDELTPEIDSRYFAGHDLSIRQKSCAMKHIEAFRRISAAGHERALVFEDDAFLVADFATRLAAIIQEAVNLPRPHVLHLGAATNFLTAPERLRPGQYIYTGDRIRNMEAYALGTLEAQLRLDWIAEHKLHFPIDYAFNFGDPAKGISILWAEPPLAEQGSLNGRFESSLAKRRNRLVLRSQFLIQKFRRAKLKRWLYLFSQRLTLLG